MGKLKSCSFKMGRRFWRNLLGVSSNKMKKFSGVSSKAENASAKAEETERIKGVSLLRKISSSEEPCKRKVSLSLGRIQSTS